MAKLNVGIQGATWRHFVTFLAGVVSTGQLDITGDWKDALIGLAAATFAYLASLSDKRKRAE